MYLAYYEMDDEWEIGGLVMLMTYEPNARPIAVSYVSGGQTFQLTDAQGFLDYGGFNIAQRGHAFNRAMRLRERACSLPYRKLASEPNIAPPPRRLATSIRDLAEALPPLSGTLGRGAAGR